MFSGTGSYLTLSLGGALSVEGGQVAFPATQNPSGGANVLDDYEEGTWTPTVTGSGGATGVTYTSQLGMYVKIGQKVLANFNVVLLNKGTITGSVQIVGLPFTSSSVTTQFVPLFWNGLATNWVNIMGRFGAGGNAITIGGATAAAANNATDLVAADLNNTSQFGATVLYRANT